ncbi:cytochrome c [Rhizobium sp. RCC_161_2]|uniref:c-type cytochrome n=1 Tax=Rhizobium sp. RCC_161_2 TaxID=3239219 RepID=UPI003525A80D
MTAAVVAGLTSLAVSQSLGDAEFNVVDRGRYLSILGDCSACHTAPGGRPFAGGLSIETPFGDLITPNITPDRDTGIGKYTQKDFQRVMSEGIGRGGYHLYPAMPYPAYTKMTADENAALFAYLQTLEPVKNQVEVNQLPFPYNQRWSLFAWNALNFTSGIFRPDASKSAQWNRGAYLVEGPEHCGTCHTPKNALGGDKDGEELQGFVIQGWNAPNITSDKHKGIGNWSADDIVAYLKTGANRFDLASGPMAEVVTKSTSRISDSDLAAIAAYLKDSGETPTVAPVAIAQSEPVMKAGAALYSDRCSGCHTPAGEGILKLFPKLANAPLVNADDATSLIHVVLAGSRTGATDAVSTSPAMPAFDWNMSDDQVASVLTFVRNSWGNAAPVVKPADVAKLRGYLKDQ